MTDNRSSSLHRQGLEYGAQLRRSSASRSKLDAAMRKSRSQIDEVYNDAVRTGWEKQDSQIKAQRRNAR